MAEREKPVELGGAHRFQFETIAETKLETLNCKTRVGKRLTTHWTGGIQIGAAVATQEKREHEDLLSICFT
ncbi:hypothetical protein JYU19_01780 [bacterium AH-315-J21]|nr:hypothetical protein [bacterium AH-315-J21]